MQPYLSNPLQFPHQRELEARHPLTNRHAVAPEDPRLHGMGSALDADLLLKVHTSRLHWEILPFFGFLGFYSCFFSKMKVFQLPEFICSWLLFLGQQKQHLQQSLPSHYAEKANYFQQHGSVVPSGGVCVDSSLPNDLVGSNPNFQSVGSSNFQKVFI